MQWLNHLYEELRQRGLENGVMLPSFEEFWNADHVEYPWPEVEQVFLKDFRNDPKQHPLGTPSGLIELYSEEVAGFGYEECPGHPFWKPLGRAAEQGRCFDLPASPAFEPARNPAAQPIRPRQGQPRDQAAGREPITINSR